MSYLIDLDLEARQELEDSYHWYEERAEGLGVRFIDCVTKKLNDLSENPEKYPKKKGNYREALIDVFPYLVIFQIFKKEKVIFVSYIFHTKRNPRLKFKR